MKSYLKSGKEIATLKSRIKHKTFLFGCDLRVRGVVIVLLDGVRELMCLAYMEIVILQLP